MFKSSTGDANTHIELRTTDQACDLFRALSASWSSLVLSQNGPQGGEAAVWSRRPEGRDVKNIQETAVFANKNFRGQREYMG